METAVSAGQTILFDRSGLASRIWEAEEGKKKISKGDPIAEKTHARMETIALLRSSPPLAGASVLPAFRFEPLVPLLIGVGDLARSASDECIAVFDILIRFDLRRRISEVAHASGPRAGLSFPIGADLGSLAMPMRLACRLLISMPLLFRVLN
jgi:hypothetical protein